MPQRAASSPAPNRPAEDDEGTAKRPAPVEHFESLEGFVEAAAGAEALPRVVVMGRTGRGKSFLLNIISGLRCVSSSGVRTWMYNSEMNRSEKPDTLASPNFVEGRGKSITAAVTGAKVGWLGSTTEPLLVVDTPGTDDTFNALEDDDEKLARFAHGRAQDFCVKLRAVEKVNAFLVLIGDDLRAVDAAKILKALRASFDGSVDDEELWAHVMIVIAKCNPGERSWHEVDDEAKDQAAWPAARPGRQHALSGLRRAIE